MRSRHTSETLRLGTHPGRRSRRFQVFGKISMSVFLLAVCLVSANATIVVNSLEDVEVPAVGKVALRSARAMAASGEPIVFDSMLNG